jgi:SAM-dependent methyltransferase
VYDLDYFHSVSYKGAKITGLSRYIGKYYWARRFYSKLISRFTPQKGKILEIGCGFGDLLSFLEKDFKTFGTDVSEVAIKEAKKRLKKTKLAVLPAREIGRFGRNSFDTIIASHILEHLKDPAEVIRLAVELLKRKGLFFMVVPNLDSLGRRLKGKNWVGYRDETHLSLYSPEKWYKLLKREGLTIEKTFGDGLWDAPYVPGIPKILQKILFGFPAIVQTLMTVPYLPTSLGESMAVLARKGCGELK